MSAIVLIIILMCKFGDPMGKNSEKPKNKFLMLYILALSAIITILILDTEQLREVGVFTMSLIMAILMIFAVFASENNLMGKFTDWWDKPISARNLVLILIMIILIFVLGLSRCWWFC